MRGKLKTLTLTLVAIASLASLTGCGKKADVPVETTETVVESTEDPFSLGNVLIEVPKNTEPAKEAEVIETQADGTYTALLEDGNTRVTMNGTNLANYSKLTESEAVYLDVIIGAWKTDSTLPEEYLTREITKQAFPSLSDREREVTISEIATETPHPEDGTKPLPEQETGQEPSSVSEEEQQRLLEEYNSMSEEEKDQRDHELSGGGATNGHPDKLNAEALEGISMGGAQ